MFRKRKHYFCFGIIKNLLSRGRIWLVRALFLCKWFACFDVNFLYWRAQFVFQKFGKYASTNLKFFQKNELFKYAIETPLSVFYVEKQQIKICQRKMSTNNTKFLDFAGITKQYVSLSQCQTILFKVSTKLGGGVEEEIHVPRPQ